MIIFWMICALMVLMALWFVLPPLWEAATESKADEARAANLLVYQDQLREMAADLKAGLLSEAQFQQDKEELERRLLEDVSNSTSRSPAKPLRSRKLAYAIAIAIPVVALAFYLSVGKPKAVDPNFANAPPMRTR